MSKGLETLELLKEFMLKIVTNGLDRIFVVGSLHIIEQELKKLENFEKNEDFYKDVVNYAFLSEEDKIKKLKALEIIKDKGVITHQECVEDNKIFIQIMTCNIVLTKEEYKLLQEVFYETNEKA